MLGTQKVLSERETKGRPDHLLRESGPLISPFQDTLCGSGLGHSIALEIMVRHTRFFEK